MTDVVNSSLKNNGQDSFRADDKISLEKLEYSYIEKCNNVKELVGIYNSLRAGVYGFYPHLCQKCELKIRKLDPHNSALVNQPHRIRKAMPNDDATKEFNDWLNEYKPNNSMQENQKGDIRPKATIKINEDEKFEEINDKDVKNNKRISGYDFRSWDLYDVDKACAEIDSESNRSDSDKDGIKIGKETSSSSSSEEYTEIQPGSPKPDHLKTPEQIEKEKIEQLEREQKDHDLSEKFKEKGNEYFKDKKYKESRVAYSKAIDFNASNLLAYNNRALVNLKLESYEESVLDCSHVLEYENSNIKALLRRAKAYKFLNNWDLAEKDINKVKSLDQQEGRKSSKDVEILSKEIERNLNKLQKENFKRMTIQSDSESEEEPPKSPTKNEKIAPLIRKSNSTTTQNEKIQQPCENKSPPPVYSKAVAIENEIPIPKQLEELKQQADEYYKLGQYSSANQSYQNCLNFVKLNKLHKFLKLLTVNLHNNLAICFIKMGHYNSAIVETSVIIEDLDPNNEKAYLRRAHCYEQKESWIPAWLDYRICLNKNVQNSNARIGTDRVTELLKDKYGQEWKSKVDIYNKRSLDKLRQRVVEKENEIKNQKNKLEEVDDILEYKSLLESYEKVENFAQDCKNGESELKETTEGAKEQLTTDQETILDEAKSQDKLDQTLKEAEIEFSKVGQVLKELRIERGEIDSNTKIDVESAVKEARNQEPKIKPSKVSLPPPEISDSEDDEPYPDVKLYDNNLNSVIFYSIFKASNGDKKIVKSNWNMLSKIAPEELTNIIGNSLEGDILFEIVKIVRKFVMPQKPKVALKYFESLTICNRFEMCLAYLEEQEEEKIYTVLKCLKQMLTTSDDVEKIQNLFVKFGFVEN